MGQVERHMNYNYNESTDWLPVELHFGRSCQLEMERWIEYPHGRKDDSWKEMKKRVIER